MVEIKPGESATLTLPEGPAAGWHQVPAEPRLVTLNPSEDGRSCSAAAIGGVAGRCTVKAVDARGNGVGYFSLVLPGAEKPKVSAGAGPAKAQESAP